MTDCTHTHQTPEQIHGKIQRQTRGYAALQAKAPLQPFTFERREPGEFDVAIDIHYCGICHSDIHQAREEWGGALFPMVPGHEIAGIVTKVGNQVKKFKIGDPVGVGCLVDSCRHCTHCEQDLEQYCLNGSSGTYNSYEQHSQIPTYGGYSENIVVNENFVLSIPKNLPLDGAAPLLCAGITLYSPLMHWKAGPGKKVGIIGLGGLGHMGVKIGSALGAEMTVLSHSLHKQADALRLGAQHFYSTHHPETFSKLKNTFDFIISTVSAEMDLNQFFPLLKLDGTLVIVGVPEKPSSINAFSLIGERKNLGGSMIGGIAETQEMLNFCGKHNITCDIEVIPVQKVNEAYERVLKSDVRYRFVLDMATLKNHQ